MKILTRDIPPRAAWALEQGGIHPLLARLYAARGVLGMDELDDGLARLLPPAGHEGPAGSRRAAGRRIAAGHKLCIVADYDCDGATACAVALRGLRCWARATSTTSCPTAWSTATASRRRSRNASRTAAPTC